MKQSTIIILILFSVLVTLITSRAGAQSNSSSEKFRGKNDHITQDKFCNTYKRSLLESSKTSATLAITDYEKGGDSGGSADCDGVYHSNDLFIVSLPTKWYNEGKNGYKHINIFYRDEIIQPMVIDESDTNNTIVASKAVWRFLQIPESEWGDWRYNFT
ncbi:putative ripening-related protein 2 [Tanacetum coccineum]